MMLNHGCEAARQNEVDAGQDTHARGDGRNDDGNSAVHASDEYLLDATSASSCENYLKGKTFTGGSARLKFGHDGTVSAFDRNGELVFGGTLEIGSAKSEVSRWVYVRDVSGGGKLKFLLSADGNMMEPSSLVIYKPQ